MSRHRLFSSGVLLTRAVQAPRVAQRLAPVRMLTNDSGPPMWSESLEEPLNRIRGQVGKAISKLAGLRPNSDIWLQTVDAVNALALARQATLLRPQLVCLGYAAAQGSEAVLTQPNVGLEKFAAGVEMQHLFMLIHDDVMDHGTMRRGIPTVNAALLRFGLEVDVVTNAVTVMGDVVHARSSAMVVTGAARVANALEDKSDAARKTVLSSMDIVVQCAYRAGAAQFEDILGWHAVRQQLGDPTAAEAFIRNFLYDKGAFHTFVAPLIAGMRLGGSACQETEALVEAWGRSAGLAFQGLDDLVDLVSDPFASGKDTFQDIREGRLSLPLVLLQGLCKEEEWQVVLNMMGTMVPLGERRTIVSLMSKYRLLETCMDWVDAELAVAERAISPTTGVLRQGLEKFNQGLAQHAARVRQRCLKAK